MSRAPSRLLFLEWLEDRTVPATFGNVWIDPLHLTASFAPDGTPAGPERSQLTSLLGQSFSQTAWQTELLQALQTWISVANVNVGLVADAGTAFGASPNPQGNPGVGDIRFGAVSLSGTEVAEAYPYQPLIGSWSGDVLLNSNELFGNGSNNSYDLLTVALHEVGHSFGLPDNNDPTSVEYMNYVGPRTTLSASDVAALQSLYGARQPDAYDQAGANNTLAQATPLSFGSGLLLKAIAIRGDVTTASDVDDYKFTAPRSGSTTISLQTAGLSLLTGTLTVYDANQNAIGSISNADPLSTSAQTLTLNLRAGQQYTVSVRATAGSAFNIGAYQLTIAPPLALPPSSSSSTAPSLSLLNNSFATATRLSSPSGVGYSATGTLVLGLPDYYRLTVGQADQGDQVLSLAVTPYLSVGTTPRVELYNAAGVLLPGQIVANQQGTYNIEVQGQWKVGDTLYIKVFGAGPLNVVGTFGLSATFLSNPTAFTTLADTSLTAATPQLSQTLNIDRTELYHFVLSATSPQAAAGVQMTLLNSQGQAVTTLLAQAGQTISTNVWLTAGTYTIVYAGGTSNGVPLLPLGVRLEVENLSNPIDPYTMDPTTAPTTSSGTTTTAGSKTPATSTSSTVRPSSGKSTTTATPASSATYTYNYTQPSATTASDDPYTNPYWF